jgi:Ankyrin repeats (3 copies)
MIREGVETRLLTFDPRGEDKRIEGRVNARQLGHLDLDPAVLHCAVPPPPTIGPPTSRPRAFVHAFTYAQTHVIPMLLRIWPMSDDLPHAAGSGDFARVTRWFDAAGRPALGDLVNHFPVHDAWIRGNLNWGEPSVQQVLDTALAFAVINNHFEIADFLLAHGADINTTWTSHEPASILHELVWHKNYEAMQFLVDRGIDMTIEDYRWHGTGMGVPRRGGREVGPVAGGGGTAAGASVTFLRFTSTAHPASTKSSLKNP